jgi:hypothetical protein
MDADTRRQLKTNELADALASLKDLKSPRFLYAAGAVVVVAIAVLAWFGWRYSQRLAAERDWDRLERVVLGLSETDANVAAGAQNELRAMLQEKLPPSVLGYARIELARSRVEQGFAQPSERPAAFGEAAKVLEQVRSDPESTPLLQAEATFLLASTYESMRQFEGAKELYQSLTQDTRYAGSPYKALADFRLADLDKLARPVAFVPGDPPPPPQPTSQSVTLTPQFQPQPATTQPGTVILNPTPVPRDQWPSLPAPPAPTPKPAEEPQPAPQPEPAPEKPPAEPGPSP